jgi:predicted dithiol-disulfide oxidoreductase (DUF899 family)
MATAEALHELSFPGETEEYRRARNSLLESEIELRRQAEAVAAQRRGLPLGGEVRIDYSFEASPPGQKDSTTIRLSELFSPGKDSLFLYSFMFPERVGPAITPCPSCTSIIDAIDGAAPHITQRVNFAVVAKVPIERFREHAHTRGWRNVRLLSSANNTYNRDYHTETPDGGQIPIATVLVRRGKKIHHSWSSELFYAPPDPDQDMRHVDFMWPMWSIFDRTPEGRGTDWGPRLDYSKKS